MKKQRNRKGRFTSTNPMKVATRNNVAELPPTTKGTTPEKITQVVKFAQHINDSIAEVIISAPPGQPASISYFEWKAKPFTREVWNKIVAFMRWGTTAHNSEVQVRLFYHPDSGWDATAKPQRANTGMTAHELPDVEDPNPEPPGDYRGTIHSHCDANAFQSGTDRSDEITQDGLHITIGKVRQNILSLHARCYIRGFEIPVKWSNLFDVTDQIENMQATCGHYIALIDVDKAREDLAFSSLATVDPDLPEPPPEWVANVISVSRHTSAHSDYRPGNALPERGVNSSFAGSFSSGSLWNTKIGYQDGLNKFMKILCVDPDFVRALAIARNAKLAFTSSFWRQSAQGSHYTSVSKLYGVSTSEAARVLTALLFMHHALNGDDGVERVSMDSIVGDALAGALAVGDMGDTVFSSINNDCREALSILALACDRCEEIEVQRELDEEHNPDAGKAEDVQAVTDFLSSGL